MLGIFLSIRGRGVISMVLPGNRFLFMRAAFILIFLLPAIALQAVTPELGKAKLRRLVKMPGISFSADWSFDPEKGFKLGSHDADTTAQIAALRKDLARDSSDADRYRRMGTLYAEINDLGNAQSASTRAIQYYRKRVDLQPDNALLLSDLGQTLQVNGRAEEAESLLRRAVQLEPKEWKCWLALGKFLDSEARRDISQRSKPAATGRGAKAASSSTELASDRVGLGRKRLEEAEVCYNAALTNAPSEAEIYLRRGLHRTLQSFLLNEIREASGERKPETEVLSDYFSTESLEDLRQASRLDPRDYRLLGNLALYEIYGLNARSGKIGLSQEFGWTALPDNSQDLLRVVIARLEDLSQDADPKMAAGALEVLGILQGSVLHERNRSLASLQRALALDSTREQAWELAAGTLARAGDFEQLLSLCEDRLKQKDSLRSHLLLAKAYEKLKRWEEAEEEVVAALKKAPNDLGANLSISALMLRRSSDPGALAEAGTWLQRCDKIFAGLTAQQKPRQTVIDFTLIRGIYLALADEVESARQWFNSVIEADQENELAREALATIAY